MSGSDSQVTEEITGIHASVDTATALHECAICGAVGLPERIANHDCDDFLDHREVTE